MCGWFGSWGGEAVEETRERLVSLKVSPRNLLVLQQELTASLFSPTPLFFLIPSLSYLSVYVCVLARACVRARARVCVIFFLFSLCVHSVSLFCNLFFSFLDICAFSSLSLSLLSFFLYVYVLSLLAYTRMCVFLFSIHLFCSSVLLFFSISELFSVYVNFFFFSFLLL